MAALSEVVKVRIDAEAKAELEARAGRIDRTPSELARRYIREGLEREGLVDFTPHRLRELLKRERDAGRAFGSLADAVRAELAKRGLPA